MSNERTQLIKENEILRKGIEAIQLIIDESLGVYGLYPNDSIITWDSLVMFDGGYENYIRDYLAATELADNA